MKQAAEIKDKLSACILIPTLAGYKVGIKMSLISAACFNAFYCSP